MNYEQLYRQALEDNAELHKEVEHFETLSESYRKALIGSEATVKELREKIYQLTKPEEL